MSRIAWSIVTVAVIGLAATAVWSRGAPSLPQMPFGAAGVLDPAEMSDLETLAAGVLDRGCAQRLLDDRSHAFAEAQVACDAFVTFALVNRSLADGEVSATTRELLERLREDALSQRGFGPFRSGTMTQVSSGGAEWTLPYSVLYRGFVLLMLSGAHRIDALDDTGLDLYDALAASLVRDYDRADLLPSWGEAIWPCDNALAASGLVLHGRLRDDGASSAAGTALVARLHRLRGSKRGFPTRVGADGRVIEALPRGTALAWTVAFLGMSGREAAEPFSKDLLTKFCDRRRVGNGVMAACREWPRGVRRGADAVSGPVIQGYGVGASALAIAATQAVEQTDWHDALLRSGYRVGLGAIVERPARFPLENAILHWARSLRAW